MSLQIAAQHLASKGRGPDTELIHMTKGEIGGLQALAVAHGGTLTINPDTGLPEAGFLSAILPILAGFALGPGGFALMSSLGAAATVGGIAGLATGSLSKGLTAGLGAFGGAGIGASLAATGAGAATGAAAEAAAANGLASAQATAAAEAAAALPGGLGAAGGAASAAAPFTAFTAPAIPTGFDAALQGAQSISDQGFAGLKGFANQPGMFTNFTSVAAPILAGMGQQPGMNASRQDPGMIRPYTLDRQVNFDPIPVGSPQSSERNYFNDTFTAGTPYSAGMAEGGSVGGNSMFPQNSTLAASYATPFQQPMPNNMLNNSTDVQVDPNTGAEMFAHGGGVSGGGISNLGSYSDGGRMLKGAGDGMSDSIPAQIGENQPARLATDEFVIPADVVSHLGNGSSDAGAKQLYKMMDKIRMARVGRKEQGTQIDARKYMPT